MTTNQTHMMGLTIFCPPTASMVASIKAVTDNLPNNGSLTDISGDITDIKTVTDNIPDGGSMNDLAAIRAVTDNIPDAGSMNDLATIRAVTDNIPDAGSMNDLAAIRAVTDNLPDGGSLTTITDETDKIDSAQTDGLLGTPGSLAYETEIVENHIHTRERWFGKRAVPTADNWADDTYTPFTTTSGAQWVYGNGENVLGPLDTPSMQTLSVDNKYFDIHRLLVTDANSTSEYKMRIICGPNDGSMTMNECIAAGRYTEVMLKMDASVQQVPHGPVEIKMPRRPCGPKGPPAEGTVIWIQCKCADAVANKYIDFYVGIHEYEG